MVEYLPSYLVLVARVGYKLEHIRCSIKWAVEKARHSQMGQQAYHWGRWCANCAVLTSVHICGHGWESITAGILLAIVVIGLILFKETSL